MSWISRDIFTQSFENRLGKDQIKYQAKRLDKLSDFLIKHLDIVLP